MNKVILMGRLTKDPEVRYSNSAQPLAIARYTLAVNRRYKREGDQEADFIQCVAFGKTGEFAEKYFTKGQQILIEGRIQVRSWDDQEGNKRWTTEVVVEQQYFADSKREGAPASKPNNNNVAGADGFYPIEDSIEDDDLPF